MQKIHQNLQFTGSESRAAMQQILKTSCFLDELQKNPLFSSNSLSNPSDFLSKLLSATNFLGKLPKFEENPLKLLSFLAESQQEVSSNLYKSAMGRRETRETLENREISAKKPTPFGRAGIHVAIAYYIYVNQSKNQDFRLVDPTKAARSLREKKFVSFF